MSWVDLVIVVGILASAAFGAMRGGAREIFSLATWIAAIWVAWNFSWVVTYFLGEWTAAPELKVWAGRAIVFAVVLVIGGLAGQMAGSLVWHMGLTGTDRVLGSIFGLGRGAILLGLGVLVLQIAGLDQDPWWREARLSHYGDRLADGIRHYAAAGGLYLQERELI